MDVNSFVTFLTIGSLFNGEVQETVCRGSLLCRSDQYTHPSWGDLDTNELASGLEFQKNFLNDIGEFEADVERLNKDIEIFEEKGRELNNQPFTTTGSGQTTTKGGSSTEMLAEYGEVVVTTTDGGEAQPTGQSTRGGSRTETLSEYGEVVVTTTDGGEAQQTNQATTEVKTDTIVENGISPVVTTEDENKQLIGQATTEGISNETLVADDEVTVNTEELQLSIPIGADCNDACREAHLRYFEFAFQKNLTTVFIKSGDTYKTETCFCRTWLLELRNNLTKHGWYNASNNMTYKSFNIRKNFHDAQLNCNKYAGNLMMKGLRDAKVYSELWSAGILTSAKKWIGYNDIEIEGNWRWLDDGETNSDLAKWRAGEPNGLKNENCGVMWGSNSRHAAMYDYRCSINMEEHICEV